ncbi:MAG TPA: 50S ribosomal protein L17, partial [Armatimonadota bacterium]
QRKLGLTTDKRMALLKGLVKQLLEHEALETTETRAKEVRVIFEKMITTARANTLHSRRETRKLLNDETLVKRLHDVVAPRYLNRPGGYTRMVRVGMRRGDAAPIVKLELVAE